MSDTEPSCDAGSDAVIGRGDRHIVKIAAMRRLRTSFFHCLGHSALEACHKERG